MKHDSSSYKNVHLLMLYNPIKLQKLHSILIITLFTYLNTIKIIIICF